MKNLLGDVILGCLVIVIVLEIAVLFAVLAP